MIEIETRCGVPWFISLIHSAGQFIADCHLFSNQNKQLPLVSQFRHQTILLSKHAIQHLTGGKEPNLQTKKEKRSNCANILVLIVGTFTIIYSNQNKQLPRVSQIRHQTILLSKHAIQLPSGCKKPD